MRTQQHKGQRVGVFVDVQNLYYSAKNIYNAKTNFAEILKVAVANRKLIRAFAYVIKADVGDERGFFDALEKIGFEVRSKDLQIFFGGAKKGDWDVGIAMDMIRLSSKLDTVILVSGDGDFRALLEYLRSMGCRTEVVAFGKNTSQKLADEADSFLDLDKNPRRFLINEYRRRSAPPPQKEEVKAKSPPTS
ncbi:NYN domain-containing protein [Candidatus Woesearchaeota archaeon]|nr:NYN domain-containing protein [Candidatus Woesearchaeota archaeon]